MKEIGVKILNYVVLLVVGAALVGVNVRQLYCHHSGGYYLDVCLGAPAEDAGECPHDCCKQGDCHGDVRHDYYKVAEVSPAEQRVELEKVVLVLPELPQAAVAACLTERLPEEGRECHLLAVPITQARLCVYLC